MKEKKKNEEKNRKIFYVFLYLKFYKNMAFLKQKIWRKKIEIFHWETKLSENLIFSSLLQTFWREAFGFWNTTEEQFCSHVHYLWVFQNPKAYPKSKEKRIPASKAKQFFFPPLLPSPCPFCAYSEKTCSIVLNSRFLSFFPFFHVFQFFHIFFFISELPLFYHFFCIKFSFIF